MAPNDLPTSPNSESLESSRDFRQSVADLANVGQILDEATRAFPDLVAVAVAPRRPGKGRSSYAQLTFRQLHDRANAIALGLQRTGVPRGARLALFVPPGIEFVTLVFALMKAGLVCILIDPGMGKRNLVRCLSEAEPDGVVGIARAHVMRSLLRRRFRSARFNFGVGCRGPGLISIADFCRLDPRQFQPPTIGPEDAAACIFTTGSTGPPKGVLYRHRNFIQQAVEIGRYFRFPPGSVDISGFPLFALFNAAMGVTTVFPHMDFTRPARVEPKHFIAAVEDWSATQSFGSPALWNTVAGYCERRGVRLATLRHVLTAGAPVPTHVLRRCKAIIAAEGEVHTPYGATEALPVACITATEVLRETAARSADGAGTCVGRRFPQIDWNVIRISDEPLARLEDAEVLAPGIIGELIVRGPVVTDRYLTQVSANAIHKIADGSTIWHRMGDVGYLDDQNRFWFCGRKSQRVRTGRWTLFTIPCEAIVNQHPAIYRSALVGVGPAGAQEPVIVAQPWPEHWPRTRAAHEKLVDELLTMAHGHPLTREIVRVYLRRTLPVDIRHNSKIFREQLAVWAARQ